MNLDHLTPAQQNRVRTALQTADPNQSAHIERAVAQKKARKPREAGVFARDLAQTSQSGRTIVTAEQLDAREKRKQAERLEAARAIPPRPLKGSTAGILTEIGRRLRDDLTIPSSMEVLGDAMGLEVFMRHCERDRGPCPAELRAHLWFAPNMICEAATSLYAEAKRKGLIV